jgi:hypothetical protein
MNRSAIPDDKAPLFDALEKLVNSVIPYVHLFVDQSLSSKQRFLMQGTFVFLNLRPIRQTTFTSIINWHLAISGTDYNFDISRHPNREICPMEC